MDLKVGEVFPDETRKSIEECLLFANVSRLRHRKNAVDLGNISLYHIQSLPCTGALRILSFFFTDKPNMQNSLPLKPGALSLVLRFGFTIPIYALKVQVLELDLSCFRSTLGKVICFLIKWKSNSTYFTAL